MTFDSSLLGTDVQVGSMELRPSTMVIEVRDVVVENPADTGHWKSPYILKAREARVDLDGETLAYSRGKEVLVQDIQIQDLDLIFEPKSMHESNVSGIQKHLDEQQKKVEEMQDRLELTEEQRKPPQVKLQKVGITGIRLKVCVHGHYGPQLSLADIHYDDFEKQHGVKDGMHVANVLLKTLMKSAADNAKSAVKDFGHHVVDSAKSAEHHVESALMGAEHCVGSAIGGAAHGANSLATSVNSKLHFPHKAKPEDFKV